MRTITILAAMAVVTSYGACVHAAPKKHSSAKAHSLPVFSFQGFDTETPLPADFDAKSCDARVPDVLSCSDLSDPVVAGQKIQWLLKTFYKRKLYAVSGSFDDSAYSAIENAFFAKYGTPSNREIRDWESKAGTHFQNTVLIWHFKGGDLELQSMGNERDTGAFDFVSQINAPPPEKPKVDF